MAINLNSIQRTKHATPPRILIHGGAKIGKSTFASQAPGAIFLPTEDGLNGINAKALYDAESGKKRLETFEEFDQALQVLEAGNHEFKTIIVDSADWLESLIHQKICTDYGVNSIELAAGGYGKGYIEALNVWRSVINRLDRLNARGMTIVLICHSKAVSFNDPEHEPYDIWQLKLHTSKSGNGSLELLKEWADVIGFASREKFVTKSQSDDTRFKARETEKRILRLDGTAAFLAGNRYGLPSHCDLTWASFIAGFSDSTHSPTPPDVTHITETEKEAA